MWMVSASNCMCMRLYNMCLTGNLALNYIPSCQSGVYNRTSELLGKSCKNIGPLSRGSRNIPDARVCPRERIPEYSGFPNTDVSGPY